MFHFTFTYIKKKKLSSKKLRSLFEILILCRVLFPSVDMLSIERLVLGGWLSEARLRISKEVQSHGGKGGDSIK